MQPYEQLTKFVMTTCLSVLFLFSEKLVECRSKSRLQQWRWLDSPASGFWSDSIVIGQDTLQRYRLWSLCFMHCDASKTRIMSGTCVIHFCLCNPSSLVKGCQSLINVCLTSREQDACKWTRWFREDSASSAVAKHTDIEFKSVVLYWHLL